MTMSPLRPWLLDCFCGAGGAAIGYHRAGFNVVGVDIDPQPEYPFEFHQMDAIEAIKEWGFNFDIIHASPPCQAHTPMSNRWRGKGGLADERVDMIAETRDALETQSAGFVIENVPGAKEHLIDPIMLQGGQFDLGVWRPRWFEVNPRINPPPKAPRPKNAAAIYGQPSTANSKRWLWERNDGTRLNAATVEEARVAMGVPIAWHQGEQQGMSWKGMQQAIPPAYTEYIGSKLMEYVGANVRGERL